MQLLQNKLLKVLMPLAVCLAVAGGWFAHRYATMPEAYANVTTSIQADRKTMAALPDARDRAAAYLPAALLDEVLPLWYGTRWAYSGTSDIPLHGPIACGYFVVHGLRGAGFKISDKWARTASEELIKTVVHKRHIRRYSNVPLDDFLTDVATMGEGVFIVGLDNHVGFLSYRDGEFRFIHSKGYACVMSQPATWSYSLRTSGYRVVGKLFQPGMIDKWLKGKRLSR